MAENLGYLPEVKPATIGSPSVPYYYVYDYQGYIVDEAKATENYSNYGVLYNWPASIISCPAGWYLPSDQDWTVLTDFLDGLDYAGGKMKSTRTDPDSHPRWDTPNIGATNTSGFSGFPGGIRSYTVNAFRILGNVGDWWSSTEVNSADAYHRYLQNSSVIVTRIVNNKSY